MFTSKKTKKRHLKAFTIKSLDQDKTTFIKGGTESTPKSKILTNQEESNGTIK